MTERASGHIACGLPRRSAVSSSQAISPCQPASMAWLSLAGRSGRASARAMPKASKPSDFARARSSASRAALFGSNVPFHQHADVARIGDAVRLGAVLDGIEQWLGHAHIDLRFLLLEFEVHRLELRKIEIG